ncbi:MAG TPA: hemerythrin domain-containing protein [Pyrinomonadaceae bacterium]|nr:hemerythrin domain-containing protein [Pyrinomonadaceae bacterium]
MNETRRHLLASLSVAGAGALLIGCRATPGGGGGRSGATNDDGREPAPGEAPVPVEVTAVEDLMREHGILRRALLVYQESAVRLRQDAASVPAEALEKTAQLFRVFGEEYHESRLEEGYIIPLIRKVQGPVAAYADVLVAQHARGREITDYVLSVSKGERISAHQVEDVTKALESFVRMYEHHATIEDTVVFPAWKTTAGEQEYNEMGERFEEIEAEIFGEDGFQSALRRMEEIESGLGLTNLDMFTAPPPAK